MLVNSEEFTKELSLSSRNVKNISVKDVKKINPFSLIRFDKVIATKSANRKIEEYLT